MKTWIIAFVAGLGIAGAAAAQETGPTGPKPVPAMQVLPLPYDQASFEYEGSELTRFHFGPSLKRPFLYPVTGPEGRSLTRMGHPRDPVSHSHHNSVWISHQDIDGVNFWEDAGKARIECQKVERYEDGTQSAWLMAVIAWKDADGKGRLNERRRIEVQWLEAGQYLILFDLEWSPPGKDPVTVGQSAFGPLGVRMAKTIGVLDGGGRLLNSDGLLGEPAMFRKPARWVDYSGPVTPRATGGITLMDHAGNPGHPTPFHVRSDGWMGIALTHRGPMVIEPGKPLRLRYALWVHPGMPERGQIDARWEAFTRQ